MAQYKSEEEVKRELGIDDWRHMTRDKVLQFASSLHKMDPEVAKKVLEQFPNFASYANDMVKYYKEVIEKVLENNTKQSETYYEVCNSIITSLQKELDREELTFSQREAIIDRMVDLAGKMQIENKENRAFWIKMLGGLGSLIVLLVGVVAAVLGVFSNNNDNNDHIA